MTTVRVPFSFPAQEDDVTKGNPAAVDRAGLEPRWLRPKDWMRMTGMTHSCTYRSIYDGSLRAVKVGRTWFIRADELEGFFDRTGRVAGRNAA